MVQEEIDPSNAAPRDAVLISAEDAKRLGLEAGDAVALQNDFGTYHCVVVMAQLTPGTLEIHWPEGNVLVNPKARSPLATIPAYKEISATLGRVEKNGERPSSFRV
jgi:anaerobic selenocysteine-containing dehydrogenase